MFGWYQNCFYLCTRFSEVKYSGCSAVRLAHLLWEQGVVGSNPATPTGNKSNHTCQCGYSYFILCYGGISIIRNDATGTERRLLHFQIKLPG